MKAILLVATFVTVSISAVLPKCTSHLTNLIVFRLALIKHGVEPQKIAAIIKEVDDMFDDFPLATVNVEEGRTGETSEITSVLNNNGANKGRTCHEALKLTLENKISAGTAYDICENERLKGKNYSGNTDGFVQKLPEEFVKNIIIAFYNFKPNVLKNLFDINDNINSENLKQLNNFIIEQASSMIDPSGNKVYKIDNPESINEVSKILKAVLVKAFGLHKSMTGNSVRDEFTVNNLIQHENPSPVHVPQETLNINLIDFQQNDLNNKAPAETLEKLLGNKVGSKGNTDFWNLLLSKHNVLDNHISQEMPISYRQTQSKLVNTDLNSMQIGNLKLPYDPKVQNEVNNVLIHNPNNNGFSDKPALNDLQHYFNFINNLNKRETIENPFITAGSNVNNIKNIQPNPSITSTWNQFQTINTNQDNLLNLLQLQTNMAGVNNKGIVELTYVIIFNPLAQSSSYVKYLVPAVKVLELLALKPFLNNQPISAFNELILMANISELSNDLRSYTRDDIIRLTLSKGKLLKARMLEGNSMDKQLLQKLCNVASQDILGLHKQNSNNNIDISKLQHIVTPMQNVNYNLLQKSFSQNPLLSWKTLGTPYQNIQYPNLVKPAPYFWNPITT